MQSLCDPRQPCCRRRYYALHPLWTPFPNMGVARTPMRQSSGEEQALASVSDALELQWPGSFPWTLHAKAPDDLDILGRA